MNIKINNTTYEDVQWNENGFSMETALTLAEIESAFTPDAEANIIVSDGDQEIARYYNKGIESITVSGSDPRTVTVQFNLTQIAVNAETEIREGLEDSDGAIMELAEIVGSLSELNLEGMADELQSHQETINTWFNYSNNLAEFINNLRKEGGILDQLNIRISALEAYNGIEKIEPVTEEEE